MPLTHNTGFTTATLRACCWATTWWSCRASNPHEFLRLITEYRVTFLATVPTVMQRLLPVYRADPDAYDLSSIRQVLAPRRHRARRSVKRAWIDLLGPEMV